MYNNNQPSERWYYFEVYIPTNFPYEASKKDYIVQLYPGSPDASSIPLLFYIMNGRLVIQRSVPSSRVLLDETLKMGRWHRFYVHALWTSGTNGYLVVKRTVDSVTQTLPGSDDRGATATGGPYDGIFKIGHYHGAGWVNSSSPDSNKVIYFDSIRIQRP